MLLSKPLQVCTGQACLKQSVARVSRGLTELCVGRYADTVDIWCVIVGSVGAACSGAALPVFAYLFGKIVNNIGGLNGANLISNVDQTVLYFVYLAIATFVASYLEMALWMLSGVA